MGDMLRTKEFEVTDDWTWHDEIESMLQSVAWAVRSTVSTTIRRSPGQLAFGRDMIIPLRINSDWNEIAATRRRLAIENNLWENANRIAHEYKKNDKVLIVLSSFERRGQRKIGDPIVKGPYRIVRVNNNGTI